MPDELKTTAALVLAAWLVAASAAGAEEARPERLQGIDRSVLSATYALGAFEPTYTPPAPGSYTLPVIASLGDAASTWPLSSVPRRASVPVT